MTVGQKATLSAACGVTCSVCGVCVLWLQFCNISFPTMLFDDPAGVSYGIIQELLAEMADLFIDEVVHLGIHGL